MICLLSFDFKNSHSVSFGPSSERVIEKHCVSAAMLDVKEPNSHELAPSKTKIFHKFNDYLDMTNISFTIIFLAFGKKNNSTDARLSGVK